MSEFINLTDWADEERSALEHTKVPFRKLFSQLCAQGRKESKPDKCLHCEKKTTAFCNSHTLPAFVLRNIAVEGKLFTNNRAIDSPLSDEERGINNSGTFHLICRQCDGEIFRDYENPENYDCAPTNRMMAQMAMKNHLRLIGKRTLERSIYSNLPELSLIANDQLELIELDLMEYTRGFRKAKKALAKEWGDEYHLCFFEQLDYVVPVAFQGQLNLLIGLEGEQINNVFNRSKDYKIHPLHAAIFPLKDKSVIILFIEKGNTRYRRFFKSFKKLSLDTQLAAINYAVFYISEDVYLSKEIHEQHLTNEYFRKAVGLTTIYASNTPGVDHTLVSDKFSFKDMELIPNFLTMRTPEQEKT